MLIQRAALAAVAATRPAVTAIAAVVGLVVGSFLNVVVYRVPQGLSVNRPGSFCPSCRAPIAPYDNVPVVSWIVLRGRCRRCGAPISPRYPLVELANGVVFGLVAWALGPHWAVPGMCVLGATLLALALIEVDGPAAPAAVALVSGGLGVVLLVAAAAADRRWWHLGGALAGAGAGAAAVAVAAWWGARGRDDRPGLPWALLPAGAVLGWTGSGGIAAGLPVGVAVALGFGWWRSAARHGGWRGASVGAAVGSVAAVVAAVAAGGALGR